MHFCRYVDNNNARHLHSELLVQGAAIYPPGEAGQRPASSNPTLELEAGVLHDLEPGVPRVTDEAGADSDHRHGGHQGHGQEAAVEGGLAVQVVHAASAKLARNLLDIIHLSFKENQYGFSDNGTRASAGAFVWTTLKNKDSSLRKLSFENLGDEVAVLLNWSRVLESWASEYYTALWRATGAAVPVSARVSELCLGNDKMGSVKLTSARDFAFLVPPLFGRVDIFHCIVTATQKFDEKELSIWLIRMFT